MAGEEIDWSKYGQLMAEADARLSRALMAYADEDFSRGDNLIVSAGLMFIDFVKIFATESGYDAKVAMDALAQTNVHGPTILGPIMAAAMSDKPEEVVKSLYPVIFDYIPKFVVKQMLAEQGASLPRYKNI